MAKRLDLKDLNIYYGSFHAVADVGLSVADRRAPSPFDIRVSLSSGARPWG